MRSGDLAAILLHEDFEGYRDLTELLETWSEVDTAGIATLSLVFDPYSAGGQRQYPRFTVNNTSGSAGSVKLQSVSLAGFNYWLPGTASPDATFTILARYRCSSGLAGTTVSVIHPSVSSAVIADDAWHEFSGPLTVFADNIFSTGLNFQLSNIPAGASGTVDFDDLKIRRIDQIKTMIDNACPVATMRADWAEGYRETISFPTHLTTAKDGSEHRSLLRVLPQMRVEYTCVLGDPVESMWLDAWLWAHHGERVAVPRWQDALRFESIQNGNTWVWLSGGLTTDRWFWPEQRVMFWRAPDDYETIQLWQVGIDYVRFSSAVLGTWDTSTLVVPLLPGRLATSVDLRRANGRTGLVPLVFDLDMVP